MLQNIELTLPTTEKVALLGGSGFIGSSLLRFLSQTQTTPFQELRLATRNIAKSKERGLTAPETTARQVQLVECDHLNVQQLKKLLRGVDIVIDLAGLAWQHPGGQPLPKAELLKQEILENAVSALVMAKTLQPSQLLVWTSTSAIEGMLARLSPESHGNLIDEAQQLINQLLITVNTEGDAESYRRSVNELVNRFPFGRYAKTPGSQEIVPYALEFSYAYSKYLGQLILERLSQGNIHALQISDVYGPGQDISARILDPELPARRIQRYIAAFREIAAGNTSWIPTNGEQLYGFSQDRNGNITQKIWDDDVFPTHVQDVCEMLLRSLGLPKEKGKVVLAVNGTRISNAQLMTSLREYFNCEVDIVLDEALNYTVPQNSQDLSILGMSEESLIPFGTGLEDWVPMEKTADDN